MIGKESAPDFRQCLIVEAALRFQAVARVIQERIAVDDSIQSREALGQDLVVGFGKGLFSNQDREPGVLDILRPNAFQDTVQFGFHVDFSGVQTVFRSVTMRSS